MIESIPGQSRDILFVGRPVENLSHRRANSRPFRDDNVVIENIGLFQTSSDVMLDLKADK
jgi:hypothetical protein